jgi:hypothetical protein
MSKRLKKKIIILVLLTATVSMLAIAGKLIVDNKGGHPRTDAPALPSAKEEYARLMQRIMSPGSSLHMEGDINLYDGAHPDVVKEKSSFVCVQEGRNAYSRMSCQETFFNGKFLVQLDSLHKLLFITPVSDSAQNQPAFSDPLSLANRLFSDTASFKVSGTVTGDDRLRHITITSDFNPEIQNFTVNYSPSDYSMKSAEIRFYKSGRREDVPGSDSTNVWISRINYRESRMKDPDVNSMISRIFTIDKDQIVPAVAYRDYKIVVNNKQ